MKGSLSQHTKKSNHIEVGHTSTKKYVLLTGLAWTLFVAGVLYWNIYQYQSHTIEMAKNYARAAFEKDLVFRLWVAQHGGVYVPVTKDTPPSPYLSHIKERDITTPSGRRLTLINPAYMTRQVHELEAKQYGLHGHLTSLNPIRPENAPDPWERKVLESFEKNPVEVTSIEPLEGQPHMRLMRPLVTKQSCLKCHASQGYKIGDIRGGLSASVSMEPLWAVEKAHLEKIALGYFALWVLGLAGISIAHRQIRNRIDRYNQAQEKIADLARFPSEDPNPVLRITQDGEILYHNQAGEQFLSQWNGAVGKKVPEKWSNLITQALASEESKEGDEKIKDSIFSITIAPVKKSGYANLYARDITALKNTEKQLRDHKNRLNMALQASGVGTWSWDLTANQIHLDPFTLAFFGLAPDAFSGKLEDLMQLCEPPDRQTLARAFEKSITSKHKLDVYFSIRHPQDGHRILNLLGKTQDANDQKSNQFLGICWDITEKKKAETLRKKREETLALRLTAIEATQEMIVIADPQGVIEYVNPAFSKFTGFSPLEVLGQKTSVRKSGRKDQAFYENLWRTIGQGTPWKGRIDSRRKNGRLYPEELSITPVKDETGTVQRYIAIRRDITEQINAQKNEQQRQSLQKAIESMQQVLGVVGHELRTPLAALRATSEYLLTDGALQAENTDQFLNSIHSEVIRLSEMVNNMLDAAQLNSGTSRWQWETVEFQLACQDAFGVIGPLIDQDNVILDFYVRPQDLHFAGDHAAMVRLLINLISNSAKNTSFGAITVTAQSVDLENQPGIEIRVQDTGEGMDASLVEKLGQAFVLNSGMIGSDYVKGTGLGLSICKGIVAAHGGDISVDSTVGEGTTFTIRLRANLAKPCRTNNAIEIVNTGLKQ